MTETLARSPAARNPMVPVGYAVVDRTVETRDSATLTLAPVEESLPRFRPGQFTMVYVPGVGEIAVSVSGDPRLEHVLVQTVRAVGAVSGAIHDATPGTVLGLRGPFGTDWDLPTAAGFDLLLVAGGIGLAPLRPVLLGALACRARYGRITLVLGARTPAEFLYRDQIRAWAERADLTVLSTVDHSTPGWHGRVGLVTEPLANAELDPARTVAFLCGPEVMMRFSAELLCARGVPASRVRLSLERNMRCGVGLCGHCQLGPLLVCRDGPVVRYGQVADLLRVKEL
ncbi:FAD/NAD(P)-binding protein [Actinophytocola oryzae]|uniref:NAD(P)H-flavin reductase n=1 Tax=Actinophytocola oryzae TaxID=502181 RepID=A0A4R7V5V3_9PSEU|nr:FAD/NAD(P)-binding protein [Actinophytocola oryzae]TDV44132.1 NAD(P)H-flavin reductase [Actinophytocola oryzae]